MAGRRATPTEPSSRVRVYERSDLPGLFMTCAWDKAASGRPMEVKLPEGIAKEAAEALAELTAAKRRERILAGRDAFGRRREVKLGELCQRYHASARAQEWSEKHRGDMERSRDFWLQALGAERVVIDLTTAEVEKVSHDAQERSDWGARKHRKLLAYLRAATRWGCDKARLYDAYPLRGLELPAYEPDVDELVYSEEEARKLLGGHPEADWRDVLAVNLAADTGRRITAILALRTEDLLTDGEDILLRFRGEYDKGRRHALVPVSAETAELLARALDEDIVREHGWLFPEGRLDLNDPRDKPRGKSTAIRGLHELERLVKVRRVKRRAFHGIKRAHVTVGMEEASGDTALVGDVTGNLSAELLRRVYRRSNKKRSRAHVERIRARFSGAESTREDTRSEGGPDGASR